MNIATTSPAQGGNPSWQLICAADALDDLNRDHAFLTALYRVSESIPEGMDSDFVTLLQAYLDTDPRGKLRSISDQIMAVARALPKG